jgi:hypothetical protein
MTSAWASELSGHALPQDYRLDEQEIAAFRQHINESTLDDLQRHSNRTYSARRLGLITIETYRLLTRELAERRAALTQATAR